MPLKPWSVAEELCIMHQGKNAALFKSSQHYEKCLVLILQDKDPGLYEGCGAQLPSHIHLCIQESRKMTCHATKHVVSTPQDSLGDVDLTTTSPEPASN